MSRKQIEYIVDEKGCHNVISHKKEHRGHVRVKRNGKLFYLHRLVFEECFGDIPEGMIIRHKCDNPPCINPEHLELGTHQDNTNDKMERGRHVSAPQIGEENPRAILKEQDIREIRNNKTSTNIALGEKFKVHHSSISAIRLNKIWKHVV